MVILGPLPPLPLTLLYFSSVWYCLYCVQVFDIWQQSQHFRVYKEAIHEWRVSQICCGQRSQHLGGHSGENIWQSWSRRWTMCIAAYSHMYANHPVPPPSRPTYLRCTHVFWIIVLMQQQLKQQQQLCIQPRNLTNYDMASCCSEQSFYKIFNL